MSLWTALEEKKNMLILTISLHNDRLSNLGPIRNPKNLLPERKRRAKEKDRILKVKTKFSKEDLISIIKTRVNTEKV